LKRKLVALLILIGSIPLLITTIFSYQLFTRYLEADFRDLSFKKAETIQMQVDKYLSMHMDVLKLLAQNPTIQNFDLANSKVILERAAQSYPNFKPIAVDNAMGWQVVKSDTTKLIEVTDRKFYREVLQGSSETISEVVISRAIGNPVIALATPIRAQGSSLVTGVLQGSIDLGMLTTFVSNQSKEGNLAFIIDQEGKVLAHPDRDILEARKDMSGVEFVKKGLAGASGTMDMVDEQGNKKLINFLVDQKTGWVICVEESYSAYAAKKTYLLVINLIMLILTVIIVSILGVILANKVTSPIIELVEATEKVKCGDLSHKVRVTGVNELGTLASNFDSMIGNLCNMITQISNSSEQVAAASEEMTASTEQTVVISTQVAQTISQVAQGAAGQKESIDIAEGMVQKLTISINAISQNALEITALSDKAACSVQDGSGAVNTAREQMDNIEQTVSEAAKIIYKLNDNSVEIGNIIATISGIASQTNLLALNAAIEAARAGEQGKGFAVVADEVRKLAEQSGMAAKQIAQLVIGVQNGTTKAVHAMNEGNLQARKGSQFVGIACDAFSNIAGVVQQTSEQVEQISRAIGKIAGDSQAIVSEMRNIEVISRDASAQTESVAAATEEVSATMQEILSASQTLAKMAVDLQGIVNEFRL
jgi:methyl-accepting chemotaxis protein